ncbi:FAD-dependent oxidoreductase [Halodesulfovibrio sp.]|jgi:dihydrolipoamide dehydrogenase|uniref:dihydrolipoyl dehydrogenase family protein n=1 Tax=Halodesulfovibrio sp. TaxID=1912772 RepID=UPI0025E48224|nr:FAD-dependent oxidoreductase [Halodesulfovibrio sp.]MCT4533888.1 FAD-dependent oxidoreductase [Halodesulfovibrio sp.]
MKYDLIIVGSGPGGLKAATRAASSGLKTALIEKADIGGTCLNWGCIPTKMYLGATAANPLLHTQIKAKSASGSIDFNLPNIVQKKDRFIKGTRSAAEKQLVSLGVDIIKGVGAFSSPKAITVTTDDGTTEVTFEKLIIATGSMPAAFPGLEPDGDCVLNSTHALMLTEAPESMIVVGAGAIGLEMGDFFSRLGAKITIVEALPNLVPTEDPDVGDAFRKILKREKWGVRTGEKVQSVKTVDGKAVLTFESGETLTADKALMAAGRQPASKELNADAAGIECVGAGWITTNDYLLAAENIYAIGDVNGRTLLAHAADHQACYAVDHAAGKITAAYDSGPMPACFYGHTEVMRVGPNTADLQKAGHKVETSTAMLVANPIAQSYGTTQGFVKVLWVDNKVHGIVAIGHGVSHLVTAAAIIVKQQWAPEDVHSIIWAHPTLDEALEMALVAPRNPA